MVIAIARIQFPLTRDNGLLKPQVGIDGKCSCKRRLGHNYVDSLGMGRSGIILRNPIIVVRGFSPRDKKDETPKRINALSSPLVSSVESEGTISTSAPLNTPTFEGRLETTIFNCRFLTLMGVVGSLSGSILCFLKGGMYVFESFKEWFCFCLRNRGTGKVILLLVEALDVYLMGTVMLIFGMGLYGLFINNLEAIAENCNGQTSETICGSNLFGLFKLQVCITMMIEREKLIRFLKTGHSTMFVFEMKDGYDYRNHMNNMVLFNNTVKKLHKEIIKNKNATDDQLKMIAQIQANKSITWMEGPLGWTAWMEQYEDLLH